MSEQEQDFTPDVEPEEDQEYIEPDAGPDDVEEQNLPEGAEQPDDPDFNPDLPDEEVVA